MQISEADNQRLHHKLPIDEKEKILAVYRHHWFAYASSWAVGGFIILVVMVLAIGIAIAGGDGVAQYRGYIIVGGIIFSLFILLGSYVPVYLKSKEQLVLTEESLLQLKQPSLFASKVDQVSLARIDDVSVRQRFWGTALGFGHITIETPGEQDNYEFFTLPKPHEVTRAIIRAHENYIAALQGGRLPSTLGSPQTAAPAAPQIDPAQYQEFLKYQQMVKQQKLDNQKAAPPASTPDTN